jgi:competence protein ComEC
MIKNNSLHSDSLRLATGNLQFYQIYKENKKTLSAFLSIFYLLLIASLGFYYSKMTYETETAPSLISGKTLKIWCTLKSELVQINKNSEYYTQRVNLKKGIDEEGNRVTLKELRLISDIPLSQNKLYFLKIKIPRDSYFLNPSSKSNIISGRLLEILEVKEYETSPFNNLRIRLNSFITNNFSKDSAPFLLSIITGERSYISRELRDAFNKTGLAHILSISGAHFGLLSFILFMIIRLFIVWLPAKLYLKLSLYLTPSQIAAIICMPFMVSYLFLSNMSIPSIRAFIMIILFLFGLLIERQGFWINSLIIAAFIILLMHPESVKDLSFHLSFIAVLCIGLAIDQKDNLTEKSLFSKLIIYFKNLFKITIFATLGTAPLIVYNFHYLSILSPITNLIITPIIGFVILPVSFLCSIFYLITGIFPALSLLDNLTSFTIDIIKRIGQLPFVDIRIPSFPIILLIVFYSAILFHLILRVKSEWNIKDKRAKQSKILFFSPFLIVLIIFIFYSSSRYLQSDSLRITFLDVGQGDSAVMELPDNRIILVDTGKKGYPVAEFLKYRGIKKIDAIILSHGSFDHAGGVWDLIKEFEIKEIWDNGMLLYPEDITKNIKIRSFQRGDVINGEGYKITILHPYNGFYTYGPVSSEENNYCLIFTIRGRYKSFLFSGDAERDALDNLAYLGRSLKSDVYKVAHHGSKTSDSDSFIEAVSPEFSIISVGRNNPYGHPHKEIIYMLNKSKILRTDLHGAIKIKEGRDGYLEVKTFSDFEYQKAQNLNDEIKNIKRLFQQW